MAALRSFIQSPEEEQSVTLSTLHLSLSTGIQHAAYVQINVSSGIDIMT